VKAAPEDTRTAWRLVEEAQTATLATLALRPPGHPFATLVAIACDDRHRPLLLLSKLAEHTKNLEADPRASILFADQRPTSGKEPLASARVTLVGACTRIPDEDIASARARYLAKHPDAKQWVTFADFGFFRLDPEEVRFVAGFGRMGWIEKDLWSASSAKAQP
jgi:heme iron utilization protein